MKKVDFTGNFIGIDNEPAVDERDEKIEISGFFSRKLSQQKTDDPIRTINLAKKIFEKKNVTLEDHDITYLKDIIKKMPLVDILTAELLTRLDNAVSIKK